MDPYDVTVTNPRVLVVDDEEHITELVAMGLTYNGFDVERVGTGRAALDAVDRKKPDLIVLDVMLPDLDGFEVARRLRQVEGAGTRVPVIFLTARDTTAWPKTAWPQSRNSSTKRPVTCSRSIAGRSPVMA